MVKGTSKIRKVLFAEVAVENMEADKTLPAKFQRMLKKLNVADKVKKKNVVIKMHLGGNIGYTTIHPVFVRLLVAECKEGKAKEESVYG